MSILRFFEKVKRRYGKFWRASKQIFGQNIATSQIFDLANSFLDSSSKFASHRHFTSPIFHQKYISFQIYSTYFQKSRRLPPKIPSFEKGTLNLTKIGRNFVHFVTILLFFRFKLWSFMICDKFTIFVFGRWKRKWRATATLYTPADARRRIRTTSRKDRP